VVWLSEELAPPEDEVPDDEPEEVPVVLLVPVVEPVVVVVPLASAAFVTPAMSPVVSAPAATTAAPAVRAARVRSRWSGVRPFMPLRSRPAGQPGITATSSPS
jgi:hypothetical protein